MNDDDNISASAVYRARIVDHMADGTPNWNAAASAHGHKGYGRGNTEEEARQNAARDLLRKIHGGITERS